MSELLKLTYFDAGGAAELSRILMKIGGIEFIDERFSVKFKEDGSFERPEFDDANADGRFSVNMNRVPILLLSNGLIIGQSKTIEIYIAKKSHLMGSTDEDFSLIDCFAENCRDIRDTFNKIRFAGGMAPNPEKDLAIKNWYDVQLPLWLSKLERSLPQGSNGFSLGNELTYADICLWHLLNEVHGNKVSVANAIENFPRIKAINEKVGELESLKLWLAERPVTLF